MFEKILTQKISDACTTLRYPVKEVVLERPAEMSHGDYACNVALALSKGVGKSPRNIAEEIVEKLLHEKIEGVEKIEIAGPGFINVTLSRDFFAQEIETMLKQGGEYGKNTEYSGKTVMIEYTDPNVMKPFHIGHLMSNTIGEALSRIIERSGARVVRANYFSDLGLGIAKAVWGMRSLVGEMPADDADIVTRTDFLGRAYVHGVTEADAHEEVVTEVKKINKALYEKTDRELNALYEKGRAWSLAHFETLYATLGSTFDRLYPESEIAQNGKDIVLKGLAEGIFVQSDGAVIFEGEKYGLHTRVFINSEGLPTYEAKELALNRKKHDDYKLDQSIVITANEQDAYFSVVLKAMEGIFPDVAQKTKHISHGMMNLVTGKMSSRTGNVITGESLISDMVMRAKEKMSDRVVGNADAIARDVAIGAIKYMVLKQGTEKNITFDQEKSLSFEGDSGPYLQYTLVRARSILEKAREESIDAVCDGERPDLSVFERLLVRLPEKTLIALHEYAPQYITQYLTELSGAFNAWYAQGKIIDKTNPETPYKIALTRALSVVLENGLQTLGIPTPQRM